MISNQPEGEYKDIMGDASESIQVALFDLENENLAKKEDFISNFKTSKKIFSKLGTNLRYYYNSKIKPLSDDSFSPILILQGAKYTLKNFQSFYKDFYDIL